MTDYGQLEPKSFWDEILALPPDNLLIAIPITDKEGNKGYMQMPMSREAFLNVPPDIVLEAMDQAAEREIAKRALKTE